MGGTPSSARIIQYADLALKALGIVYHKNGASVEGLEDRNGYRRKKVGEGRRVSWGGECTKGKGRECEITKICSPTMICCSCVWKKMEDH